MEEMNLIAVVLVLRSPSAVSVENHMGRAVQQLGLEILGGRADELTNTTHALDDMKATTVSGLMHGNRLFFGRLSPQESAWVRFTGLSAEIVERLRRYHDQTRDRLEAGEKVWAEIDRHLWQVVAVYMDNREHRWAGYSSYQRLIDRNRFGESPQKLDIEFCTPTTFHVQGVNLPLPQPAQVFGSLLNRWVSFTSHRLRDLPLDQVEAFTNHHVMLSRFQGETMVARGKQGSMEIGFVGSARYEVAERNRYLERNQPETEQLLREEYVWLLRTINLLHDYAFFSGIGAKTTTGLGLVRGRG